MLWINPIGDFIGVDHRNASGEMLAGQSGFPRAIRASNNP
ncbi:hypothetical protein FEP08_05597 [Burkholderia multivorans]|nr:hypothetical protein [Burkholderia multivorans]